MTSGSIARIERLNYAIGAIAILATLLTQTRSVTLGLTVGTVLSCLNFYVLRKLVTKWTTDAAQKKISNAPLLMMPKMLLLMGAFAAAVFLLPVDVIAMIVGYSIFIVSIIVETTYTALRPSAETNENGHG